MLVLYYECINVFPFSFQSDAIDKLPAGQRTFAVLARAYQVDVYEARMRLFPKFVAEKCSWVEAVSSHLLGIKKRELDDFLSDFLRPDMPLDEIGILMFSRMMHKHCVVFFNDLWWTTRRDNDVSKVDCWLIYRGKCQYTDTIPLTNEEFKNRKAYLDTVEKQFFGNPDENLQSTTEDTVHQTCTVQKTADNDEEELLEDVASTFDVEVSKPKPKPKRKSKSNPPVPLRRSARIKHQDDMLNAGILSSLHSTNSDLLDLHSTNSENIVVHSTSQDAADSSMDSKPGGRKTHNSLRAAAAALALSNSAPKPKSAKFSIRRFQLRKRHKKKAEKKCSTCKKEFPTYAELEKHVKRDHPQFKYKCRYCPKIFNSSSWKYQHQVRHKGLRYQCSLDWCSKLFQFGYQLRDHLKKHTKKSLYVCSTRKCGEGFTTKRARTYHQQQHSLSDSDKLLCTYKFPQDGTVCGKSFLRKNLLTQHMNGHIGQQLTTYCGKIYNWPNARKYHQDNCEECKAMREKNKAVYRFKKEK